MDEPSAILDDREVETLFKVVRRLTAEGVGIIYITHRLDEIARIADVVTVLRNGKTVATSLPADTSSDELVGLMVGGKPDALFPQRPAATGDVVLDVQHLSGHPVQDISFSVRAGEVVGLAGLVGSGRTELLRFIYGMEVPASGAVTVAGAPLPHGRPHLAIAAGMGMAPEERKSQALMLDWDLVKGGLYWPTFMYNPSMSASAVNLARLIAREEGMQELAEPDVPSTIVLPAATVTAENVEEYRELGF